MRRTLPIRPRLAALAVLAWGILACQPGPTASPTARPAVTPPAASADASPGATPESSTPPSTPAAGDRPRIVIDTDVAPDDLIALASILPDPSVEILAITVSGTGEAHCEPGVRIVRALVTALQEGAIPVACGPSEPLGPAQPFPDAWRASADAGSGLTLPEPGFAPDPRSAPQLILDLADAEFAANRRLRILTTGPVTNLAAALELDPSLPGKVRVVSMLGAVAVPGNVDVDLMPVAEWNAHADPTAARLVIGGNFDLTLIPLDATNDVPLTAAFRDALAADHAAGPADLVVELLERNPYLLGGGFYLWDPLAAAAIRNPDFVTTTEAIVQVMEGAAFDGGRIAVGEQGVRILYADSADAERFEAFLLDRLRFGGPRRT